MDLLATLTCKDTSGIVHTMTDAILKCRGNIIENQQFTDPLTGMFCMRTRFTTDSSLSESEAILKGELSRFAPELKVRELNKRPRALILVTKESHCLRDLLYLRELGELPVEIPLVVSNHEDLRSLVESHGIPFEHIPVNAQNKSGQEPEITARIKSLEIDVVVLARYMQILSKDFCNQFAGHIINIHHSFLPGFKGARPYHQAYERGVKIIGATAHFVTEELDEGPIIEQDVAHVTHSATPEELISIGRDIERRVLAKAVRMYAEDRIFLLGNRTVIFN
ncbi:MAG: formyltetrahydrofolate deformylase [Actinobacteria bacterium]|nr:formyltetrahydrofolate deformylase [Actinomycetota bacterium]